MTLRNSFFKLLKQDLKTRLWTTSLYTLMFFIGTILLVSLQLSNKNSDDSYVYSQVKQILGFEFNVVAFFTIVCAIVSGLSIFNYLHSKKKTDLYHSLPIKREWQFIVNFISGIVVYVIPYGINMILSCILVAIEGHFNSKFAKEVIGVFFINFLFYVIIYTIVICASLLSGNLVVAFLGTGVFLSYGVILSLVRESVISNYFTTYSYLSDLPKFYEVISPIYRYGNILITNEISYMTVIKLFVGLLILIGCALYLFKNRPSEAAGKAMAFSISKPIIKVMILIPCSLLGAQLFGIMTSSNVFAWNIFGLIFVSFVGGIIIEMIYNLDVKAAFLKWKEMVFSLIVAFAFISVFEFNVIDLDKSILKVKNVEYGSINIEELNRDSNHYIYGREENKKQYINKREYILNNLKLTNIEDINQLIRLGVESNEARGNRNNYVYHVDDIEYVIKLTLENGKEIYRSFRVAKEKVHPYLENIYGTREFKEASYQMLTDTVDSNQFIVLNNLLNGGNYILDAESMNKFYQLYQLDLLDERFEDLATSKIAGQFRIGTYDHQSYYYILPTHTRTIELLNSIGYKDLSNLYNIEDITSIKSYGSSNRYMEKSYAVYDAYTTAESSEMRGYEDSNMIEYTKKEEIERILPHLIYEAYYWNNSAAYDFSEYVQMTVSYRNAESGESSQISFVMDIEQYNILNLMGE